MGGILVDGLESLSMKVRRIDHEEKWRKKESKETEKWKLLSERSGSHHWTANDAA